jgi:hypothetical protein
MEASGRPADQRGQSRLDIEVDVLERPLEAEPTRFDLGEDTVETAQDGAAVPGRDDLPAHQHRRMGLGCGDVVSI